MVIYRVHLKAVRLLLSACACAVADILRSKQFIVSVVLNVRARPLDALRLCAFCTVTFSVSTCKKKKEEELLILTMCVI